MGILYPVCLYDFEFSFSLAEGKGKLINAVRLVYLIDKSLRMGCVFGGSVDILTYLPKELVII